MLPELAERGYAAWKRDCPDLIAVDTETEGFAFYDRPFCATISWKSEGHYFEFWEYDSTPIVREILAGSSRWVFHNAKFDLQKLILYGLIDRADVTLERFENTQTAAHLLDENRPKALKSLAVSVLGYEDVIEVEIKSGKNKGQTKLVPREAHELAAARRKLKLKKDDGYHLLPREVVIPYAIKDTDLTFDLWHQLWPQLERWPELVELYRHEKEVTLALLDIESRGLTVDLDYVDRKVREYGHRVMETTLQIEEIVGRPVGKSVKDGEFNPASVDQLKAYFAEAGHPTDATDENALKKLDHPLAPLVLKLRSDTKMRNTYFLAIQNEQRDGVLHPNFNETGARTGRMSSSGAKES